VEVLKPSTIFTTLEFPL